MSLNVERTRELWHSLSGDDPHAMVRQHVIAASASTTTARGHAAALLSAELLRDPHQLMTEPPLWLLEISRSSQPGTALLFDSRLTDLAARSIDDLIGQGVDPERIVAWLDDLRRDARHDKAASTADG
jgi:hypothetical protein